MLLFFWYARGNIHFIDEFERDVTKGMNDFNWEVYCSMKEP